ncbi:hypothetical protein [Candidatus Palauibacter polyketidifaciens]|uniref:hypothetical protein n=1 Tax=Candidatus Palauibacter polyketidifaciens TaxID=3056740 RepID=UPI002390B74A|nr:hypothetical protein [Candidatus Palauibacter polyketidifaciens]MDE2719609.1 hypothetical protein [Candidatus Palauibacter polyketidifaciens]
MSDGFGFERLTAACAAARARVAGTAAASAVTLGGALILVLSLLPVSAREGRGSLVPLALAFVLWAGLAGLVWIARRVWHALHPHAVAEEADAAAGLGAGDVRSAIELEGAEAAAGAGLAALHRTRVSEALGSAASRGLLPVTGPGWKRRIRRSGVAVALMLLAISIAALLRPQPTFSAAAALGAPWRTAFPAPLPPLGVTGETGVPRGDAAVVAVSAAGRDRVDLVWRAAGRAPERVLLDVSAAGSAQGRTAPIISPTAVWAEDAEGFSSDTLRVRPLEPLLVQDLQLTVEFPAYLGRGSERYRGRIPPLVAPEGTRLRLSGETNLPLDEGVLAWEPGDGETAEAAARIPLEIAGSQFAVSWVPERTGAWAWELRAESSLGEPIPPDPIRVLVVPDLQPRIHLLYPAPDTTLGYERVMPIIVDIEDDIGLRRAFVRSWRSGLGSENAERREALSPDPAGAARAVFRHLLDRSAESFLPGDTLFYRFEAFDGHPARGPALSDVFLLRVPTFTEIRDQRADQTEALSEAAQALEENLEALAEAAADAARQTDAEGDDSEDVRFEATEEARSVLDEAQRSEEELEGVEEQIQALQEELEASPLSDPALQEQLRRLAERYEELTESGLEEQIEALAEALRELDPEAVREALEQLAGDYEDLREQVDQTLGMLEQAALEQAMKSAQANADELAQEQREVAGETDPETFQDGQELLVEQAEALAERLAELEAELAAADREAAADSARAAGERTQEALGKMADAQNGAEQPPSGAPGEVGETERQAAEEAAAALEQAAGALGSAQREMSGEQGEAAVESLARARSEALALSEEEGRLSEATRGENAADPTSWRARQGAVRQGLENLVERLSEAGNEAAMLDQRTGAAAGEAAARMDQLLDRLAGDGARRLPSRAEVEGIQESLNSLARHLLASEEAARAAGQEAAGQDAADQMNQLAQQQQAVTQETSSLLMPGPRPSGEERRREEIARRQEEVAEELGELEDPEGDLLGRPEELAEEAAELAQQLELEGPTQETLERQRQLFRRMLDAGRSLEDEDLDPNERESREATAPPGAPPPIDPELLRGRRYPTPSEALLRELPLFYRSLIFEYFDRLNRVPPAGAEARREP